MANEANGKEGLKDLLLGTIGQNWADNNGSSYLAGEKLRELVQKTGVPFNAMAEELDVPKNAFKKLLFHNGVRVHPFGKVEYVDKEEAQRVATENAKEIREMQKEKWQFGDDDKPFASLRKREQQQFEAQFPQHKGRGVKRTDLGSKDLLPWTRYPLKDGEV